MTQTATPTPTARKLSKVEGLKEQSNYLREPVATELLQDTNSFSENATQILKFHGSYQQDNRDNRVKGQEKDYQFMLRTRSPGGFIPPQLYLTIDKLSDEYGNQTIRATTRQGFQLHGILKKNLKAAIAAIVNNMGSTLGACGDINRNVMAPPAPYKNRPEYKYAWEYANNVADLLTPQSGAYYEVWLDGEKVISAEEDPEVVAARKRNINGSNLEDPQEPIYGTNFMPRKFKCSVTVPGDNSVDLFSQDLSLVVITNSQGELLGFDVFAGGGLGRTHNQEETFPRLADPICYVDKADVYDLVKAIVATQRDYGDRTNRRHARMKYLIEDWGVAKFKKVVEGYFGKALQPFQPLPEFKYLDFLGWHEQGDGKLFLGISIDNGRVKDEGEFKLKTALKEIVQKYQLPMYLTPHQNLILAEIEVKNKQEIQGILDRCGIKTETEIDPLVRYSMACPALPTCGLAITESERIIPSIRERLRALLVKVGLQEEHFVVRMTGCPNGCARPYLAEIGLVGQAPDSYQIWLGADPHQTRLARPYLDKVNIKDLETTLEPLLVYFRKEQLQQEKPESFGDFCDRVGFEALRSFSTSYQTAPTKVELANGHLVNSGMEKTEVLTPVESTETTAPTTSTAPNKIRRRISVRDDVYDRLKQTAARQGKPLVQLATEAIEAYLKENGDS
ncbi:sulfite reductase, ferredoxin dependent [[Phormidium ambiguum] IAM M-71]|uniref:Sulfite reductase [ferredoxin] n=1 Tax=[Phormidium ambiguum] IAM M-71 TaxID=454136 RepID=A0A1U7INX6_9CYAN|nr:sulfite reductase, ferredoxin dependent [Phormidium ambiguum]OKH38995.1 sulfite reductase, ferredoxin dependent [Phormidium ambiguum IAM M-71]